MQMTQDYILEYNKTKCLELNPIYSIKLDEYFQLLKKYTTEESLITTSVDQITRDALKPVSLSFN